jgi:phosphatidylglycerophosphate synthase
MISKRLDFFRTAGFELVGPPARFLLRLGVSANIATGFSFLMGALAVFFLFDNNFLFALFAILHLITDSMDGAIARIQKKTTAFGLWFDHFVDRGIVVLLLAKSYFYLPAIGIEKSLFLAMVVFYVIQHLIFIISNRKIILIYSRSIALVMFMLGLYAETIVVLLAVNFFGIVLQIINFVSIIAKKGK